METVVYAPNIETVEAFTFLEKTQSGTPMKCLHRKRIIRTA